MLVYQRVYIYYMFEKVNKYCFIIMNSYKINTWMNDSIVEKKKDNVIEWYDRYYRYLLS
jgi:hemerythrin superfamily protein